MSADKYGSKYWMVETNNNESLCLFADEAKVTDNGDLLFVTGGLILLSYASGVWVNFHAASVVDGSAVAVDNWLDEDGVLQRRA